MGAARAWWRVRILEGNKYVRIEVFKFLYVD